jgi:hypothetical protein
MNDASDMSKLILPVLFAFSCWAHPCAAQKIKGRLKCELSRVGFDGGVGAGTIGNEGMRLTIDTNTQAISLNGLKGRLLSTSPNQFTIIWNRDVVRPNRLNLVAFNKRVIAKLVEKDTKWLLEFSCR